MTTLLLLAALTQQPDVTRARHWAECIGPIPADAVAACTRLIQAGGLSPQEEARAYETRGVARGRLGAFNDAISDLTRVIAIDATRAFAYYMRAGVHLQMRQFEPAISDLRRAAEIEPENPSHPRGLASALNAVGDFKGALGAANRALELLPEWAPGYAQRGIARAQLKDVKGALEDLDRAVQMDPRQAAFLVTRGELKADAGDYFGATQDFEKAMVLAPGRTNAVGDRGLLRMRMRDYAGAIADFEAALAENPRNYSAIGGLVASLIEARVASGDVPGALRECTPDRLTSPPIVTLIRACAVQYGRVGQVDESLSLFATAVQLEPRNAATYHSRAISKSDRRDFSGALTDLRTAIGLDASRDYTSLRLWLVEARLGDRAAATTSLRATIARRTADNADEWVITIARYLVDEISEDELMRAAESGPATKTLDRRCEAYFYSGWKHLVNGETPGAETRFEQSVATGARTMLELHSAAAELAALRKK